MTFGYKVMIESNSGKWPSCIWQIWWPQWALASAPSKNEFSVFSSASVPNLMLVDKSPLKNPLEPRLVTQELKVALIYQY